MKKLILRAAGMNRKKYFVLAISAAFILLGATTPVAGQERAPAVKVSPASMPRVGSVDERFQSYNIEMVEVTGGRFWKPYDQPADATPSTTKEAPADKSADEDQSRFQYRPPIDLTNSRLRKLASALAPAYVRISGTWANITYFQDSEDPAPPNPPNGFNGVLTRQEWKGVIDFSKAVNAKIVTSFAVSPGTRDASGVWTPNLAQQWVAYTKSVGGSIAAAEFINEPNIAMDGGGGLPKTYSAADFGRDIAVFHAFVKQSLPDMLFLGPGGSGEATPGTVAAIPALPTADLMEATGPVFDIFTYHFYGAASSRCAAYGGDANTTLDAALSERWLGKTGLVEKFYSDLRDRFEPGKALWLTETAQAACGGDRWASTYIDSFRYLNQLGTLASRGVQVTMHNTFAASDYALIDTKTYTPRPNYWSALLWHKLMGTTVLDPGPSPAPTLHLFAHCLRNHPGGVALLALNTSKTDAQTIQVPAASDRYNLTARELTDRVVLLNGSELKLGPDDALPDLHGKATHAGGVTFTPASITFLAFPNAHNASCQ
jgi:heparanase